VVVSKKVSLRAVDRNRIKRRGRAVLQSLTTGRPEPLALSFLAKREALKATFQEVEKDVRELFERAGLRDTMRTT
jgi:ribonuclease P protein component